MKLSKHNELMEQIWGKIVETRDQGQKEYAQNINNVFANFERVGEQVHIDRQHVLWVYLAKHMDGIASFINGHKSQREDVRGRITDVIVYLGLLWGMIDEDEEGIEMNGLAKDLLTKSEWIPEKQIDYNYNNEEDDLKDG